MYGVAGRLDPDGYLALARATFAEMVLAGITCVGEFHYLHHAPGGHRYDDPNAMGHALVAGGPRGRAAARPCWTPATSPAGSASRRTACSSGSPTATPTPGPARTEALHSSYAGAADVVVGAAVHSVRAVPADQLGTVAAWAAQHEAPVHAHVSEQPRENDDCRQAYGVTPTRLLHDHGVLGPRTTAVHATHLTDDDIELLGRTGTAVCMCPTTERDLADGVGPAGRVREAGSPVTLGSDSHAVVDLLEEARAVELDERLASRRRGHWSAAALVDAATRAGHVSLGWPDGRPAGRRRAGRPGGGPARLGAHRGRRRRRRAGPGGLRRHRRRRHRRRGLRSAGRRRRRAPPARRRRGVHQRNQ